MAGPILGSLGLHLPSKNKHSAFNLCDYSRTIKLKIDISKRFYECLEYNRIRSNDRTKAVIRLGGCKSIDRYRCARRIDHVAICLFVDRFSNDFPDFFPFAKSYPQI